ncbi:N-6 DNA methylase [Pseudomonas shirazica]|uniref:N-6 DNA methylase n=1 Tax=Pseudomonas shirazica TaxID=1940636 RepID=UPI003525F112
MRVEQLKVKNFRGIKHLEWNMMEQSICCLIGVGDSAKTTVLDAVEAALSPRWMTFNEADFHHANTAEDIEVEVTIGELSRALLSDGRFGLYLRGLSPNGRLNDEPEDADEPVLTVRLSVDATMEPVWSLVCDRYAGRKGLFLIDASKGFIKDGNKNRLREQDIHKIVDTFTQQIEVEKFARLVPMAEIEANDFNLNIPRYIDTREAEDLQDIEAHLHGGIPEPDIDALYAYWQVMPNLRSALFEPLRPGYLSLKVAISEIKPTIFSHPEFEAFRQTVAGLFEAWRAEHRPNLAGITIGDQPKALLKELAEDLLHRFEDAPLLDAYDVYQHLQDYWYATLQDDVYQLVIDGWKPLIASGLSQGEPNTDLLPPELVVRRYYAAEAAAITELEAKRDATSRELEELDEEQGCEDGPLSEGKTDKGKLTAASVKARLKAIKHELDVDEERQALENCLALIEREAEASKKIKAAQKLLDAKVLAHFANLSEAELKTLVIDDKWLATLQADVQTELDRVSQALSGRIRQLAERYDTPLPALNAEVEALETKVNAHLMKMGFSV